MTYRWLRWVGPVALTLAVGCTQPNPGYGGAEAGVLDGAAGDLPAVGEAGTDGGARLDSTPDLPAPTGCTRDEDCADSLPCTDHVCNKASGQCRVTIAGGWCLIGGDCRAAGMPDPAESCRVCDPPRDERHWTARVDSTPCTDDGLGCTTDVCKAGVCRHEVEGCLIGGTCHDDGDVDPANSCGECRPALDHSNFTFVAGKECPSLPGALAGVCAANKCRNLTEWSANNLLGLTTKESSLASVAPVPGGGVWAVGSYLSAVSSGAADKGAIVQLGGIAATLPTLTDVPMRQLHHKMAVGAQGVLYRYDGSWSKDDAMMQALDGRDRQSIWGVSLKSGSETYLLGGEQKDDYETGVIGCSFSKVLQPVCVAETGVADGDVVGGIVGTLTSSGAIGSSWAAAFGNFEDVFHSPAGGTGWTAQPPKGCFDNGSTPCADTFDTEFTDIFAGNDHDVWVVGLGGLLVHYNGQKWERLKSQFQYQADYDLDAVFSAPADNLVTIVGHRDVSSGRWVSLFNYNPKLDEWFGPITVRKLPSGGIDGQIRDIGGDGYSNLWLVGHRAIFTGQGERKLAWTVRLQ